jgi:hypothetical protein
MERQNNAGYTNSFYDPKYQGSKPVIQTDAAPLEYNGYLIYKRSKEVFDVVSGGICVGMYAGINGAKKAIDNGNI